MSVVTKIFSPKPVNIAPFLPSNALHLWYIEFSDINHINKHDCAICSISELAYAATLKHTSSQFLHTRVAMRRILGEYANIAPKLLQFSTNPNGKPYISWPQSALQFNLSHSSNLCILAVRWGGEIGLDVERVRPRPGVSRIARRLFAPEVSQKLDTVCSEEQIQLFYYYWTRFEASIKAKGGGLFDANMLKDDGILCVNFLPAPGFYGCIAAYDSLPAVEYWEALSLI